MKNKIFFCVLFFIILGFFIDLKCYASTLNISSNKTKVNSGDTVEVYINLGIESIAYDLKISANDETLVKSKELTSNIGKGDINRLYLIQPVSSENRIIYNPNTRLAVLKYKLADNIAENKVLEISITGDVAGKSSSEKNSVNEKLSVKINWNKEDEEISPGDSNNENNNQPQNQQQNESQNQSKNQLQNESETENIILANQKQSSNNDSKVTVIKNSENSNDNSETSFGKSIISKMPKTGDEIIKSIITLIVSLNMLVIVLILKKSRC